MAGYSDFTPVGPWSDGQFVTRNYDGVLFTYSATLNALIVKPNWAGIDKDANGFRVTNLPLPRSGPAFTGDVANRAYVDSMAGGGGAALQIQGTYDVAANVPDLTPAIRNPQNGQIWIAENSPPYNSAVGVAGIPGVTGVTIWSGDFIVWNATGSTYSVVRGSALTAAELVSIGDTRYLRLTGGTLTGVLTLNGNPPNALDAAPKQYVDSSVGAVSSAVATKVSKSGDTMTGPLVLPGDPTTALQSAPKQYVDSQAGAANANANTRVAKSGDTMTGPLVLPADPTTNLQASTKQYVDTQDALKVAKAGDTMTGPLVLPGNPTLALQAAPKQYVDTQDALKVAKAGDTMTGPLVLPADPTTALQAATKQYVDATAGPAAGAVRYDVVQTLSGAQTLQARTNIGAAQNLGYVRYDTAQGLTAPQQAQARANLAANLKIKTGSFTWNISSTGIQNVTGVGFQPIAVFFLGGFNANYVWSTGWSASGGSQMCVFDNQGASANTWGVATSIIIGMIATGADLASAQISSYDVDGFSVNWSKGGSPGGVTTIGYLCIGYGA